MPPPPHLIIHYDTGSYDINWNVFIFQKKQQEHDLYAGLMVHELKQMSILAYLTKIEILHNLL